MSLRRSDACPHHGYRMFGWQPSRFVTHRRDVVLADRHSDVQRLSGLERRTLIGYEPRASGGRLRPPYLRSSHCTILLRTVETPARSRSRARKEGATAWYGSSPSLTHASEPEFRMGPCSADDRPRRDQTAAPDRARTGRTPLPAHASTARPWCPGCDATAASSEPVSAMSSRMARSAARAAREIPAACSSLIASASGRVGERQ